MTSKKVLVERGKELSFLLRHDKNYSFDAHGYRTVEDLIKNHNYSMDLLIGIVETNEKKRYEFNEDKTKIRARQGHSVNVNVDLKETTPPDTLYHGTAIRFLDSIKSSGIKKMGRTHVHLSSDMGTATNVGSRHGNPIVLDIDAKAMHDDGLKFYLSNNNVWLTDFIDTKYIKNI